MIAPQLGEPVLVIKQGQFDLINQLEGCPQHDAAPHINPNLYYSPFWTPFTAEMPWWGTGLMVVRDGVLTRSLAHWDSSD